MDNGKENSWGLNTPQRRNNIYDGFKVRALGSNTFNSPTNFITSLPVCLGSCWSSKEIIFFVLFIIIKQADCRLCFRSWRHFSFRLWLCSGGTKQPSSFFLIFITEQSSPRFSLAWLRGRGRFYFSFGGLWGGLGFTEQASIILLRTKKKKNTL